MSAGEEPNDEGTSELRERAERELAGQYRAPVSGPADMHRLIHELQVHEIELALQCEELRASRAEAEAERARYAELYDFAPTGYLSLSRDGIITAANLSAASLLGIERAALLRGTLSQYVARGDRHLLRECVDVAFRTHAPAHCELSLERTTPDRRDVRLEVIADESGRSLRISLLDITARRRAEAGLVLRDRAIRALTHGIVITDPDQPDNPIIYVNPGFERMSGYSAEQILGRSCRVLQGPDTDPAAARTLHDAVKAGVPCAVEILNYTRTGDPFWNALSVTPVRDTSGRLTHWIGVQVDVSERRRLERELLQSQRMEAVGRLAGGVAHDFNNLLTVINGFTDVLQSSLPTGDPLREFTHEIGQAGERAAMLTRQLLTFSRRQAMTMSSLDVNLLVRDTGTMLRRLIGEDIDLRIDLPPAPSYVTANAAQLEQVLMNLSLNARDAMPNGGTLAIRIARVQVDDAYRSANRDVSELYRTTHRAMRTGPYVVLTVSDTGVGMDAATAARVFEPFFTTKGVGQGTGLGLSMVFGAVEQLDGYIVVDSERNRGSEFSVFLPSLDPAASEAPAEPTRERLDSPSGSETILLVEDEASVRLLTARVLRRQGYRVLDASDGRDALAVAAAYPAPIHLLLTDVVMPELGGRALAEMLQQRRPGIRVLFMSGYPDDEVLRRGIQHEGTPFLAKPFNPAVLTQTVRAALDEPSPAARPA